MLHHILRNTLGPLMVLATLDMGWIIRNYPGTQRFAKQGPFSL